MTVDPEQLGVTAEQYAECVRLAGEEGRTVDEVAVSKGYVDEKRCLAYFAGLLGMEFRESLTGCAVPSDFTERIPISFARQACLVGVGGEDGAMTVATASPLQTEALDNATKMLGAPVRAVVAPRGEILSLIDTSYEHRADQVGRVIEEIDEASIIHAAASAVEGRDLLDVAHKAPVVKLTDMLLFQARKNRASDVHLHPYADKLQVRFRVDGILHDIFELPKGVQEAIVSRVKVMGGMDIAEKRIPQDGRTTVRVGRNEIDLRISSLPTSWGERIVMRLLDKGQRLYKLEQLGLEGDQEAAYEKLIRSSHGIILVTGPTGSGKTTTLYATLDRLNVSEKNVLTLEDPIEYRLQGISQTQVNYAKGLTFATGLRTILRQDPDVIMVGEIRDLDTARMAIQSALTGHLVFSTLHTNDAVSAAARLLDIGIEPYLVSSSLLAVMAQRLVRAICPSCRERFVPAPESVRELGLDAGQVPAEGLWRGAGCEECLRTGYYGRTGIYELLLLDEDVRRAIMEREGATEIKRRAVENGLRTLRASAAGKVLEGVTTPDEALRVTQMDTF